MKSVPTFAVAGDPNVGKSTLIATLAEEDSVQISNRAGTTKRATPYTATLDGTTILKFIDLPGFENTPQLKEWLDQHRDDAEPGKAFVAEFQADSRFQAECEILQAIDGAGVIFVVDATRPVEPRDRDQAEILRLCTDKRMAVINIRSSTGQQVPVDAQILEDWKILLGKHFTYQCFDPLDANFRDRLELLEAVSHVMPGWRDLMKNVIERLRDDWEQRRIPEVVSELCGLLEKLMKLREREPLSKGQGNAERDAKRKVENEVRKLEEAFRKKVRKVFHHKRGSWEMSSHDILGQDVFSERVWKLFGLTKGQLITSAAMMGAVIGAGIDLLVGGASIFMGTIIGAISGAVAGYLAAGKAVDFHLATDHVEAKVDPKSNLAWIVIDRGLLFIEAVARWSHGRRETTRVIDGDKYGIATKWSDKERKSVIQWIGAVSSGKFSAAKTQQYEQNVRALFSKEVRKLTIPPPP